MSACPGFTHSIPDEELRDLLEALIASSPVAIMITDGTGKVIGVNKAHAELTGLTNERIVLDLKMNFREYLRTVNPEAANELEKAYAGETVELSDYFYKVKPPPGVEPLTEKLAKGFWINARAFPIKDEEGRVKYVVILNEDITAKKELEMLLVQAQKMETIGTLAGGLAHDFNNILSAIIGYASLLAARLPEGTAEHDAVMTILEAGDRATTLTSHLMAIARKSVPSLQRVSLVEELPKTVSFLTRTIGPKYPILLEVEEDCFEVDADRPQLEQVITNLCLNARDAMPDGGPITIRAKNYCFGEGKTPIPTMPPGEYVGITIEDRGQGIPPEVIDRIFEPFFTTKTLGRGTGLGLAVVYGIVKSHRGFIHVKTKLGEGSAFTVFLPRSRDKEDKAPEGQVSHSHHARSSARSLSILVVDDDDMVRRVLRDILVRLGHEVEEASSVEEALRLAANNATGYDCMVVDVLMPERDGFAFIESLRGAGITVPILVCTGYATHEVVERARSLQRVTVLAKPFSLDQFDEALRRLVGPGGL